MSTYYKIGEIAALYGISTDILRYYEELGILVPRRAPNGYRIYRTEDLWCLNAVSYTHLQKIGDVVGKQGKVINKIIEETGVKIDINDDGSVNVCGTDEAII